MHQEDVRSAGVLACELERRLAALDSWGEDAPGTRSRDGYATIANHIGMHRSQIELVAKCNSAYEV